MSRRANDYRKNQFIIVTLTFLVAMCIFGGIFYGVYRLLLLKYPEIEIHPLRLQLKNEKEQAGIQDQEQVQRYIDQGYIPVYNADDLASIEYDLSGRYVLADDISLADYGEWYAIGDMDAPFPGELIGGGHVITGLQVSDLTYFNAAGLFSYLQDAVIRDVGITDVWLRASVC